MVHFYEMVCKKMSSKKMCPRIRGVAKGRDHCIKVTFFFQLQILTIMIEGSIMINARNFVHRLNFYINIL